MMTKMMIQNMYTCDQQKKLKFIEIANPVMKMIMMMLHPDLIRCEIQKDELGNPGDPEIHTIMVVGKKRNPNRFKFQTDDDEDDDTKYVNL